MPVSYVGFTASFDGWRAVVAPGTITRHEFGQYAFAQSAIGNEKFFTRPHIAYGIKNSTTCKTSQATPITAVAQQVSIALGVALAGGILELSTAVRQAPLQLADFHIGFFIVALVSATAIFWFARLAPDAGHELSSSAKFKRKSNDAAALEETGLSNGK